MAAARGQRSARPARGKPRSHVRVRLRAVRARAVARAARDRRQVDVCADPVSRSAHRRTVSTSASLERSPSTRATVSAASSAPPRRAHSLPPLAPVPSRARLAVRKLRRVRSFHDLALVAARGTQQRLASLADRRDRRRTSRRRRLRCLPHGAGRGIRQRREQRYFRKKNILTNSVALLGAKHGYIYVE